MSPDVKIDLDGTVTLKWIRYIGEYKDSKQFTLPKQIPFNGAVEFVIIRKSRIW
jgi:hypothetical protein